MIKEKDKKRELPCTLSTYRAFEFSVNEISGRYSYEYNHLELKIPKRCSLRVNGLCISFPNPDDELPF